MKKLLTILLAACFIFTINESVAQLSKDEKKDLKNRLKTFKRDLESFQNYLDEHDDLRKQVNDLTSQVNRLQSQSNDKDSKISELQDQLNKAKTDLAASNENMRKLRAEYTSQPSKNTNWDKGLVFRVQIGAFQNKDLQKYFDNHPNFGGEVREDGEQAITLGVYRDYWEADTFKKYLREMGVKDAWIVPFQDGQRVDLKEVLEGIEKKKETGE